MEVASSSSAAARSRSAEKHGLNPAENREPERVDGTHLRERLGALEKFMTAASPRLDNLFSLVGQSGCAVLLTDSEGIVLDQRITEADTSVFEAWGLCSGADWSVNRGVKRGQVAA